MLLRKYESARRQALTQTKHTKEHVSSALTIAPLKGCQVYPLKSCLKGIYNEAFKSLSWDCERICSRGSEDLCKVFALLCKWDERINVLLSDDRENLDVLEENICEACDEAEQLAEIGEEFEWAN